jgi:hypothetical protein
VRSRSLAQVTPSPTNHDVGLVQRVLSLLCDADLSCWVFGGWAEQLRGLRAARPHNDIDLLCVADDRTALDLLVRERGLTEINGKRLHHKRAFLFEGVMVEIFLVQTDERGFFTSFWGTERYDWPADVFSHPIEPPTASTLALIGYREDHAELHARGSLA